MQPLQDSDHREALRETSPLAAPSTERSVAESKRISLSVGVSNAGLFIRAFVCSPPPAVFLPIPEEQEEVLEEPAAAAEAAPNALV